MLTPLSEASLFLLDMAWKSAALLVVTGAVVLILRRASAAARHLTWTIAVTSLLLLPLLSAVLPGWRVHFLPRWEQKIGGADKSTFHHGGTESTEQKPGKPMAAATPSARANSEHGNSNDSLTGAPMLNSPALRSMLPRSLISIWLAGVGLALLPLVAGWIQIRRLTRRSPPVTAPDWIELLRGSCVEMSLGWNVALRRAAGLSVPVTWGARQPVLLVPAEAEDWARERRRMALLHELAHIRRGDWPVQMLTCVVCALYWFNPLVWFAARRMAVEREQACDDLVLAAGPRASDYAGELLAIATSLRHGQLLTHAALPMARRSILAGRIQAILARDRNRSAPPRQVVLAGMTAFALALIPISMMQAATDQPISAPSPQAATRPTELVRSETPNAGNESRMPRTVAESQAFTTSEAAAFWPNQMASLNNQDWRAAFALGEKLTALPPDEGFDILNQNWRNITHPETRQQLLKAWAFFRPNAPQTHLIVPRELTIDSRPMDRAVIFRPDQSGSSSGRARVHARLLDVLDLGMGDPDPGVRSWAVSYLKPIALRDFATDFDAYNRWRKSTARRPVLAVVVESLRDLLAKAQDSRSTSVLENLAVLAGPFYYWPDAFQQPEGTGLEVELRAWLEQVVNRPDDQMAEAALKVIALLPPDELYLRRVVVPFLDQKYQLGVRTAAIQALGNPNCAWALDLLLDVIQQSLPDKRSGRDLIWTAAQAIGEIHDSRAIPFLIDSMAADDTYDTIYGIGYFALGRLTDVPYDKIHDSIWWRAWWEKNKTRFPGSGRSLETPRPNLPVQKDPAAVKTPGK